MPYDAAAWPATAPERPEQDAYFNTTELGDASEVFVEFSSTIRMMSDSLKEDVRELGFDLTGGDKGCRVCEYFYYTRDI